MGYAAVRLSRFVVFRGDLMLRGAIDLVGFGTDKPLQTSSVFTPLQSEIVFFGFDMQGVDFAGFNLQKRRVGRLGDSDADLNHVRRSIENIVPLAKDYELAAVTSYNALTVDLSAELVETLAEAAHAVWMEQKIADGWSYAPKMDRDKKRSRCLVPFGELPEVDRENDRELVRHLAAIVEKAGYVLKRAA